MRTLEHSQSTRPVSLQQHAGPVESCGGRVEKAPARTTTTLWATVTSTPSMTWTINLAFSAFGFDNVRFFKLLKCYTFLDFYDFLVSWSSNRAFFDVKNKLHEYLIPQFRCKAKRLTLPTILSTPRKCGLWDM